MSLAHFLAEYATHPFLGPYYDHWLQENNFGTFGHIWQPDWSGFSSERTPSLDWFEGDTSYTLHIEVPGVKKEDMTMHVSEDGHSLTIEGKTEKFGNFLGLSGGTSPGALVAGSKGLGGPWRMARSSYLSYREEAQRRDDRQVFPHRFAPSIRDGKRIVAKLENGILSVTLPKLHTPKPRRIVID
ncbi:heat shock protein HSP20 family protein [Rhizoctonia solani]|uniref:Heat shock protein HSP20 family protein n=1 Tax=Rhizoctonia solani TaxID=456999 RepID=A0A8H8T1W1_9AGAM|nr:heat shock protein HSP20 family protein [Rhizoctonia solani]QRW26876.1 heat shock protein HSP20 family protein [Rhizoctonia solani]